MAVAVAVGVRVGVDVRVGVLKFTPMALHSVPVVMSDASTVNPLAAIPDAKAPSCVATKTIVWQVPGLLQSPCRRKPSGELWVGGTLLPGARLPTVLP